MKMRERYTGVVFDVSPDHVEARIAMGFIPLEETPQDESDASGYENPAEDAAPASDDAEPVPDEDSTIAEIRAYAKRHGIKLPKGGKKAELLALL